MMREAIILGLLLFSINGSLWVTGYIGADEIPNVYKVLPPGLTSLTPASNFQNNLAVLGDQNTSIVTTSTTSFVTSDLTFLEDIPVIGTLFTYFRAMYEVVIFAPFGFVIILLKWAIPPAYIVFMDGMIFLIISFGALAMILNFIASRGGTKT